MSFWVKLRKILKNHIFREDYTCSCCQKENFNNKLLCDDCESKLERIGANRCSHCGRALKVSQDYCSTCKGVLLSTTTGKSVFNYKDTIALLIQRFKYNGASYLAEYFAKDMANLYFKNYYASDYLTFVPMTKRAQRKRGYNQSQLLANALSKIVNVPVYDGIEKVKKTKRQAKLGRKERRKNLDGAFKVVDKKTIKGKLVTIIDDVTTTGSTIEVLANRLLKAGAKEVKFLTIASVPPSCGY